MTLQGLWATPFLMTVLRIDRALASQFNMLIPIGVIIGAPLFGWLPNRFAMNNAHTLRVITGLYALCWLGILLLIDRSGVWGYALIFGTMGILIGGFISTIWGIIRETTPIERLGLTSGLLNPAPFLGVAAYQMLTGAILDRSGRVGDPYPLAGFTSAFGACLAGAVVCLLLSMFIKANRIDAQGNDPVAAPAKTVERRS